MAGIGKDLEDDEEADNDGEEDGDLSPHERNDGKARSARPQVAFAEADSFRTP
jgi:hypothetical protein